MSRPLQNAKQRRLWVPDSVFRDLSEIGPIGVTIYLVLVDCNFNNRSKITIRRIAERLGCSESTVWRYLKKLVKRGHVASLATKGRRANDYLLLTPNPVTGDRVLTTNPVVRERVQGSNPVTRDNPTSYPNSVILSKDGEKEKNDEEERTPCHLTAVANGTSSSDELTPQQCSANVRRMQEMAASLSARKNLGKVVDDGAVGEGLGKVVGLPNAAPGEAEDAHVG